MTSTTFPSLPSTGEHPAIDLRAGAPGVPGAPGPLQTSALHWPDPPAPSEPEPLNPPNL